MKSTHVQTHLSVAAFIAVVSMLVPAPVRAGGGVLDSTFGTDGTVLTDFSGTDDYALAVAVQPNGKMIVAGRSGVYPVFHAALVRYNGDGSLDPTFGADGTVTAALDPGGDGVSAIALQPDGKIVAAGSVVHDNWPVAIVLARFNADGSLDQSFASGGIVITTFGDPTAEGNDVVLQADGKIVVVGVSGAGPYSELNDFALVRYNADGSLDQGFGNGGKVKTHFPGVFNTGSAATSVVQQADGKLVVAGEYKNEGTHRQLALARYQTNGSLDGAFGTAGQGHDHRRARGRRRLRDDPAAGSTDRRWPDTPIPTRARTSRSRAIARTALSTRNSVSWVSSRPIWAAAPRTSLMPWRSREACSSPPAEPGPIRRPTPGWRATRARASSIRPSGRAGR
jgi:uncharacterized delta-60 repeat protein